MPVRQATRWWSGWLALARIVMLIAVMVAVPVAPKLAAQDTAASPEEWKETPLGPRPDWSWLAKLRFVTETDYPPFNYYDEDGQLIGFNIDLARAICRELDVVCEINALSWDALVPSVQSSEADAIIASLSINARTLKQVDFTSRYYATPARFAARLTTDDYELTRDGLDGVKVGVVKGTAHEAFMKDFFPDTEIVAFDTGEAARNALRDGGVELVFGDGISLMFWILGTDSARCCEFRGEGYLESRYFGDGVGIAIQQGNIQLKEVLDYALARVRASGRYEELMLRYFPLSLY
jgi:polar amino acid transport system substrate-binding protein